MNNSVFNSTDVITILGKRGSGKTTLCKKIQTVFPRVVIFDRLHEYDEKKDSIDLVVETFDEFAHAVKWSLGREKFRIAFRFDIEADNHDDVFNHALRSLYYRGSVCTVIEEVHNFATPHFLPQWFREELLTGRHQGIGVITTSQRPAEVHKTLLSQSHHIFCGELHEKNDLNYLSTVMGNNSQKLSSLRTGLFLHFRPGFETKIISN